MEPGETLPDCVAREVAEKTGLRVEAADWVDSGGPVGLRTFMTRDEIRRRGDVFPAFLADGAWLDGQAVAVHGVRAQVTGRAPRGTRIAPSIMEWTRRGG